MTIPALSAERLTFTYPPFGEFSIAVDDLEVFAKDGRVTPDFAFYVKRTTPQQREQLRHLLQQRFALTPVYVSQFTYSPLGEKLFERLGDLLQTDARTNGLYALRSALILAAADQTEGLTVINVMHRFPSDRIRLNLTEGLALVDDLSNLLRHRDEIVRELHQLSTSAASSQALTETQPFDLRVPGTVAWHKQSFDLRDPERQRAVPFDLYLPETSAPAPVIVISHGVAENRQTFAYLAQHLASYGFAVIAIAHRGGDATHLQRYLAGLEAPPAAPEFLDRPRDVSYVLDELQRRLQTDATLQGHLKLEQVGLIGHSLGGYTALALAGATLNFKQIQQDCHPNRSLNLSVILQCRAGDLPSKQYTLRDPRIKAVFAINPLSSTIFSQQGMSQIQLPVAIVGGSEDIFTPAVPEQIRPFTWLQTPNKYLVLIEKGNHFSAPMPSPASEQVFPLPSNLLGSNPALAQAYIKALSLAFFQTHLANRAEFQPYLSAAYVQSLSQAPLTLSLLDASQSDRVTQLLQTTTQPVTFAR
ncbi:MAG: alpha/beta hydrolase [Lyngbya sp. HA4199-MV5]|nr:alpha/beta hydrolase [Lyngbya sp. HA4199-MV5]